MLVLFALLGSVYKYKSMLGHRDIDGSVAGGVRMMTLNYAFTQGTTKRSARPVLLTCRATRSTKMVLLHPDEPCAFHSKQEKDHLKAEHDASVMAIAATSTRDSYEATTPSLEELSRKGDELSRQREEAIKAMKNFPSTRFQHFVKITENEETVGLAVLSPHYAVQVMPTKVRVVQLTPFPEPAYFIRDDADYLSPYPEDQRNSHFSPESTLASLVRSWRKAQNRYSSETF